MPNAQIWLNQNYSQKNELPVLFAKSSNLEGKLIIDGKEFPNLERIYLDGNNELKSIELNSLPKLTTFTANNCQLNHLKITNCLEIIHLNVGNNLLDETEFLANLNPEKLIFLSIHSNNFSEQDLSLNQFVNLERLYLDNSDQKKIENSFYNRWTGSLEKLVSLKDLKELSIGNTDIASGLEFLSEKVEKVYCNINFRKSSKCKSIIENLNRSAEIKKDEKGEYYEYQTWKKDPKRNWEERGFDYEEIDLWSDTGLKLNEWDFACYLKKEKNLTPPIDNLDKLRVEYIAKHSEEKINQFIQEAKIEKISYESLENIEYLTEGGFGKIYQAEWEEKNVILKSLNNSQELTPEFLKEIASHELFDNNTKIVKCYGISQDPESKNYLMVMDYVRGGNLREYLKRNHPKLDFKKKLIQLHSIAEGLKDIHQKGLVHKDFHSGNILSSGMGTYFADLVCSITDLGLCRPANEKSDGKIYGVLPYVAPEVLRGKNYTQASDIYSFGIVACEIFSGKSPYCEYEHDELLAMKICQGLRPRFEVKVSKLLEELIRKCWEAESEKRPAVEEILEILTNLRSEINNKESEFSQQVREAEEFNKSLISKEKVLDYKIHSSAVYTSRLLDFKGLPEPQNSKEVNEEFYSQSQVFYFSGLGDKEVKEEMEARVEVLKK